MAIKQQKLPLTSTQEVKSGCCMGTATCLTDQSSQKQTSVNTPMPKAEIKKGPKTRVVVRFDVGFNNILTIRGKGANLNWDKGAPLRNTKPDEWIWETEASFNTCEFKVLINDNQYEIGENHPISCGASIQYTPKF